MPAPTARPARIFYEGGGYFPRGARPAAATTAATIELQATPPTYGLRYVSDADGDDAPILIWSARGEEAWLAELAAGQTDEREIAHCTRLRARRRRRPRPSRRTTELATVTDLPHRGGRSAPGH